MAGNNRLPLTASRDWTLPLREASALGFRATSGGGIELLSVDDDAFHLARATVTGADIKPAAVPACVATALGSVSGGSNFEGVAADGTGRVFVLREAEAEVVVFDPDLTSVEQTIKFHVDSPLALREEWNDDKNARGEGLLLLQNGHMLVAKQKEQPWLFEIGPEGATAGGLTDETALRHGDNFELPDDGKPYVVLEAWRALGLESLNDLALDGSGRLHVVSSRSACIGRLGHDLLVGAGTVTFQTWALPSEVVTDRKEQKAEGLVHWAGHGWLVALDLGKEDLPNLFHIEGMPG